MSDDSKSESDSPSFEAVDDVETMPADKVSIMDLLDPFSQTTEISKTLDTMKRKGDEIQTMMRKRREGIKHIAKRQRDRVIKDEDLEKYKLKFMEQVDRMEERMANESVVSATEKLTFSLGLLNIFLIGFSIGDRPHIFHKLYTIELALLLPIRFYTYTRRKFQYYLADLCYFANFLNLLYIWVFPNSVILYVSCYGLCFGTLPWAVIAWRNSLVLHSVEKTTSTFIHILPPTVFHIITHRLDEEYKSSRFPGAMNMGNWKFLSGILWTSVVYFVWQSLYHYFITLRRKEKIKAGRVTSFEHLRKVYANTRLGKFVNSLPEPWAVVAFTGIQYSFQLVTMLLCPIWYSSGYLSALFLCYIFLTASYNGATYYIDVFGKRFQKQLLKLQAEMANTESTDSNSGNND